MSSFQSPVLVVACEPHASTWWSRRSKWDAQWKTTCYQTQSCAATNHRDVNRRIKPSEIHPDASRCCAQCSSVNARMPPIKRRNIGWITHALRRYSAGLCSMRRCSWSNVTLLLKCQAHKNAQQSLTTFLLSTEDAWGGRRRAFKTKQRVEMSQRLVLLSVRGSARVPDVLLFCSWGSVAPPHAACPPSATQPGWMVRFNYSVDGLTLWLLAAVGALLNHSL